MASEYYKWLARDVKPEETRELTREEKWKNWWYYHKWHVIIGIFCLIFLANIGYDMAYNAANKPDYKIAYVGTTALPEDTVESLEQALATLGEDLNGNGKVQVELLTYQLMSDEGTGKPGMDENSAERGYNASMMLLMNIETVESMIFLLEDPAAFSANYPVLVSVDGVKEEASDEELQMYYRWADCPVLTSLDLKTFEIPLVGETAVGDSQKAMENICVARRGLWDDDSNETIEGALRLWEIMTEGAK